MKAVLESIWRWSLLITLPVAIGFGHWLLATADRYRDFGLRNTISGPLTLETVGRMEFDHMIRQLGRLMWLTPAAQNSGGSGLRTVSLYVPESTLAEIDSNLPHSGFQYVDGGLWDGDKIREVEVRYRGDNIYHWGYFKKSWRIKTKKDTTFEGMRRFNLIAPITAEIVNNHLSYLLASSMGLVTPRSELVNATVNGKLSGIYVLTEQLSELTLRRHGLMPGDLYSGEVYGRESYRGVPNRLFTHPGLWEKVAVNNHYAEESMAPLEHLVSLIRAPQTEAIQAELTGLLDLDAFGRFHALEILLATAHMDTVHNWRLYYDPWRRVFIPVVWDPVGWFVGRLPPEDSSARLDVISSPFHAVLHRNGEFLRARHRALTEFFDSGEDVAFMDEVERVTRVLDIAVQWDPNLVVAAAVQTPAEARTAMDELRKTIPRLFAQLRAEYIEGAGEVIYKALDENTLAIQVSGRRPVDRLVIKYGKALDQGVSARIRFWRDGEAIERDVGGLVHQTGTSAEIRFPLLSRFVTVIKTMGAGFIENHLQVEPGYYEMVLEGIDSDNLRLEVMADRGGKQLQPARRVDEIERRSFDGMFALIPESPVREPIVWRGDMVVNQVLDIDQEVIIRPGTTLRMEPGASVIFRGRVWAEGTAEEPIRVLPARQGQEPWGTIALQGRGANGSLLNHCEFVGGSGLTENLFEYSAMFSIHDVDGVSVEFCRFSDNKVVDDMVHAVYSRVRFSDCVFERALFDAMDLDVTEGTIERCEFHNSGNDGLDLMASRVVVLDTLLQGNRDKGISVGEDTKLLAIGCRIIDNIIGVESKDRSVAVLSNVDLQGNGIALHAYDKNWQYEGGGFTYLYNGRILDNDVLIEAKKGSGIWIHDTYMVRPLDPEAKRVELDSVDNDPTVASRVNSLWRFPGERERMDGFGERFWLHANPSSRGTATVNR